MDIIFENFIWNKFKERANILKHKISFYTAALAFKDPKRKIFIDETHSLTEERHFCIAKVNGRILTVRFTHRDKMIRIIGAGYWRKGKDYYENKKI
ncbi:MAG: BrnT family toxin [Candidatus Omnitrophica bacterium]|nr:BrnT family toxin [Candidatus Omnitrophota bacterium]